MFVYICIYKWVHVPSNTSSVFESVDFVLFHILTKPKASITLLSAILT